MCFRPFRTLFLVGGGLLLGSVLLFGRNATHYLSTSAARVHDSMRESVPIEYDIAAAEDMIEDLVPDIRQNMKVIAKEEVEVDRLEQRIGALEERLAKRREDVLRLKADLAKGERTYRYAGHVYAADDVREDLANRFERYKVEGTTLENLKKMHQARLGSLEAARKKLAGMMQAKEKLQADLKGMEARLKMLEVAQTTGEFTFDDSKLARTKELMDDIHGRLAVLEKLAAPEPVVTSEIPLDEPEQEDVVDQVDAYFNQLDSDLERTLAESAL